MLVVRVEQRKTHQCEPTSYFAYFREAADQSALPAMIEVDGKWDAASVIVMSYTKPQPSRYGIKLLPSRR